MPIVGTPQTTAQQHDRGGMTVSANTTGFCQESVHGTAQLRCAYGSGVHLSMTAEARVGEFQHSCKCKQALHYKQHAG